MERWKHELPTVEPFYAVKCLPDPIVLKVLSSMGCNFDCATMKEIDLVVNNLDDQSVRLRGTIPTSIVYSNPAKMPHMLDFAIKTGVQMTVFDGEDELFKIAAMEGREQLQLLLRLATDDAASICQFSTKFGCPVDEAPYLLELAQSLGLHVAGVSFHVGSGCGNANAYTTALEHTQRVFEAAERLGMSALHIVDIGGGFPGEERGYGGPGMPTFAELCSVIRQGIVRFLENLGRPASQEAIRFIAEPGRFFVSASTTIATKVFSRKGGRKNHQQALYVDDGVYGSFNNVVYDHATPVPEKLTKRRGNLPALSAGFTLPLSQLSSNRSVRRLQRDRGSSVSDQQSSIFRDYEKANPSHINSEESDENKQDEERIPSFVFGPTCDGLDQMCSIESTRLPRCEVGDWLVWTNQGAYTHTASFDFNGFTHVPRRMYCSF